MNATLKHAIWIFVSAGLAAVASQLFGLDLGAMLTTGGGLGLIGSLFHSAKKGDDDPPTFGA